MMDNCVPAHELCQLCEKPLCRGSVTFAWHHGAGGRMVTCLHCATESVEDMLAYFMENP